MSEPIIESGMMFDGTDAWGIEKSSLYSSLNEGNGGLKAVEFIRAKGGDYFFVEARSSFPNLKKLENVENIEEQVTDILNKFTHSLSMLSSVCLRVNDVPSSELPEAFRRLSHPSIKFVLVLRFPDGTESICEEIRTRLESRLSKGLMRIWNASLWVMNTRRAQELGLVLPDACEAV